MIDDHVQRWLTSGRPARIEQLDLHLVPHPLVPHQPLCMERGQAANYVLRATDGRGYILKKFHPATAPERAYLEAVGRLVPRHPGCRCATERRVLSAASLGRSSGHHSDPGLARWLENTVLMPMLPGASWAATADRLRAGELVVGAEQRLGWCRQLVGLVGALEHAQGCHRDLAAGNLFIDVRPNTVALIDWDAFFHPSLSMPRSVPCGSDGYLAPFIRNGGRVRPDVTWGPGADRFPMALLIIELLLIDAVAPQTSDGGMFDQDELFARSGPGLAAVRARLEGSYPLTVPLFDQSLRSTAGTECPAPEDWQKFLGALQPPCIPCLPPWPAPRVSGLAAQAPTSSRPLRDRQPVCCLQQLPEPVLAWAPIPVRPVTLPPDPWGTVLTPAARKKVP